MLEEIKKLHTYTHTTQYSPLTIPENTDYIERDKVIEIIKKYENIVKKYEDTIENIVRLYSLSNIEDVLTIIEILERND